MPHFGHPGFSQGWMERPLPNWASYDLNIPNGRGGGGRLSSPKRTYPHKQPTRALPTP